VTERRHGEESVTEERMRFRETDQGRSLWRRIVDLSLTDVSVLVKGIDEDSIEELERVLLEADFGLEAAGDLVRELESAARRGKVKTEPQLRALLAGRIRSMLDAVEPEDAKSGTGGGRLEFRTATGSTPYVVLLVGVNGTGKTTTAAKIAFRAIRSGLAVTLAATDTFRSGAQEQLRLWAERLGAGFVGGQAGGDPAAVAFDAAEAASARGTDVLIIDTAGRLHTQRNLMEELRKIDRVTSRHVEGAPHDRLLVVDATAGQNVLNQVREFGEGLPLTGIVMTKYDSTARGGTAVAVSRQFFVPVRYVGTGEAESDLALFDPVAYVEKLLD
jgi:fused signal recognition particle receptor